MGWPHPDYLLDVLTPTQFTDWAEYYSIEPWAYDLEELRFGMMGSLIAHTMGGKLKPSEFTTRPTKKKKRTLKRVKRKKNRTPEEIAADAHTDDLSEKLVEFFRKRTPEIVSTSKGKM